MNKLHIIEYLTRSGGCGLNFWRNNSFNVGFNSALYIGDDGWVGIGNTDPQARLDVNGLVMALNANIEEFLTTNVLNSAILRYKIAPL